MAQEIVEFLFHLFLAGARLATGIFLLAVGFYLQVIAEGSSDPDAESLSWKFRILPAVLGFFVLHGSGGITLYPIPPDVTGGILYVCFLAIVVEMYQFLFDVYALKSPKKRIPEFICEALSFRSRPAVSDDGDDEDGNSAERAGGDSDGMS